MKKILMLMLTIGLALSLLVACAGEEPVSEEVEETVEEIIEEPVEDVADDGQEVEYDMVADAAQGRDGNGNVDYVVELDMEGYGVITIGLDATYAPITVENFVKLVDEGFYDGLTFHRIIEGFMMQGGCPYGNGGGGSGEHIIGEFRSNGIENPGRHYRGAISMARTPDPNSASSQFFIVHQDHFGLDDDYAVFGHVLSGMEVVDAIVTTAEVVPDSDGAVMPENQPVIHSARVIERR